MPDFESSLQVPSAARYGSGRTRRIPGSSSHKGSMIRQKCPYSEFGKLDLETSDLFQRDSPGAARGRNGGAEGLLA